MMAPNWAKLRSLDPDFDWEGLEASYELVDVPRLPWSAVRGLLSERISATRTATMSDGELQGVCGVGPVSVRQLRAAYPRQQASRTGA
jgi:hypothetical protein